MVIRLKMIAKLSPLETEFTFGGLAEPSMLSAMMWAWYIYTQTH